VFVPVVHSVTVVLTAKAVGATLFHVRTAEYVAHKFPNVSFVIARPVCVHGQSFPGAAYVNVFVAVHHDRVLPSKL